MSDDLETIFPLPLWAIVLIFVACLPSILLSGCASTKESPSPRSEVCMVQPLGQTDTGLPVVALTCVTPEVFAESQK